MLIDMHRVSLVSIVAAGIVMGHVAPHLLGRLHRVPPSPTHAQAARAEAPPLLPPVCRLQPPLAEADREPMLEALRQLIARDGLPYPYLAADGCGSMTAISVNLLRD
jgi:hypothetical protein